MSPSDRTERGRLQQTIGELGYVHPYHYRAEDLSHPEIGWYVSPAVPVEACSCELCEAARRGRDIHLGSISRMAHIRAGAIVSDHLRQAEAA